MRFNQKSRVKAVSQLFTVGWCGEVRERIGAEPAGAWRLRSTVEHMFPSFLTIRPLHASQNTALKKTCNFLFGIILMCLCEMHS